MTLIALGIVRLSVLLAVLFALPIITPPAYLVIMVFTAMVVYMGVVLWSLYVWGVTTSLMLALFLVATFVLLVAAFSLIYWKIGTPPNFATRLSPLDAVYFTLGTLSTAGTGTIAPQSEVAKLAVTAQDITDVTFIGLILAMAVSRAAAR